MRPAPLPTRSGPKHGSLRRRLAQTTALAGLLATAPVLAQTLPDPSDGNVAFGAADITKSADGSTLTISTATPRTVIDWSSFNVGAVVGSGGTVVRETANFTKAIDPDTGLPIVTGAAAVLNRVVGNDGPGTITQSRILGNLISDPDVAVYLLNPQGVLFGATAQVNVGSLVASTLDTDPALFFAGAPLTLRGSSTQAVETLAGAQINAQAATRGIVALVGARIDTRGALTATGEIALVAATDTTISFDPASPLSVVIREGSPLSNPIVARNTMTGSSILLAGATRSTVNDGLLDVQATLTATSAYATDRGIVLAAGPTAATNANVAFPTGRGTENTGAVSLRLGGALNASGDAGAIDIRARNGVTAPIVEAPATTALPPATLNADQGVLVRADTGGVALGNVTSRLVSASANGVDISAGAGAISAAAVTAGTAAVAPAAPGSGGAGASVLASGGSVTLGSLFASQAAAISGSAVTAGAVRSEAGTLDVTATAGTITADSLSASGRLRATATGGDLVVDSATSQSSGADLVVRAVNVLGRSGSGARAAVSAGRDLDFVATGSATLGAASAGRAASLSAVTIDSTSLAAGTMLGATATTGALTVGDTNAGATATLQAGARATLTGNATVGTDLLVSGAEIRLGGAAGAVQQAGRTASYTAVTGTIAGATGATGLTIRGDAGGTGAGAVILDANTGIDLSGIAVVTGAPSGASNTGDAGVRLVTAAAPLTLGTVDARALLSVNAARTVFSPLTTGGAVTLGATRLVNGLALSTPGTISLAGVAVSGAGQTLSVAGAGAATTITSTGALSATNGVSVTAPGAVTLAGVAGGSGAATIESSGAGLSAGAVTGGSVAARARNALSLTAVNAGAGAAALTSATASVTVTGSTQASGNVTVDAPGAITMTGGVRSTGGTVVFQSTGGPATGAITAGAVRASTDLTVSRAAGLTFASATSDTGLISLAAPGGVVAVTGATSAARSVAIEGASLALGGPLTAIDGAALLRATAGGVTVGGAIQASGTVTVDAPGAIGLDDVRSVGGAVVFQSTGGAATGAITAGLVRSSADLSVSRAGGLTLGGAISDTGAVSLASPAGLVTVTGATNAATAVTISGANAALGSVTAGASATVTATDAITATGAILAGGAVLIDAPGAIALRDVRSTGAGIRFQATALPVTGGITAGAVRASSDLIVSRAAGLTFGSAASDTGQVALTATGATVNVTGAVDASTSAVVTGAAVRLGAVTAGTGTATLTATSGGITVAGAAQAAGDVTLDAPGAIELGDVRSTGATVVFRSTATPVTGAVSARDVRAATNLTVARGAGLTFRSATSDTGAVSLASAGGAVTVTGGTTAATNVTVGANAMTLGTVAANGGAVDLFSAVGRIDVSGAITARNFVRVDGATGAQLASVTDTGTAASLLRARNGGLTVTGATSVGGALAVQASGAATLGGVTSTGGSVTLDADGVLTAGVVRANGALTATGATSIALSGAQSDTASVTLTSPGAVVVNGATLAQANVLASATGGGSVTLGAVTSAAGTVRLSSANAAVNAGAVRANGALAVVAGTGVALSSAASDLAGVEIAAAGTIGVTGGTSAQTNIATTSGGAQTLGDATSRAGAVTLASTSGTVTAAAVTGEGALSVAGAAGVTLASARSVNAGVTLTASAGPLAVSGATRGRGDVAVTARDAIALGAVTSDAGAVTIVSSARNVGAATLIAAGAIDAAGATGVAVTEATSTGSAVALRSSGGGVAATTVGAATALTADAAATLSITTAAVGTDATLAGRDIDIGTFGAGTLQATARGGDLTVAAADIRGAATLTKTGASGAISIARLNAAGPTQITSAGTVRADLLQGGATTVTAAGDVAGRTGGLGAAVSSLTVNAGGGATIGAVTTSGFTSVNATGAASLIDAIVAGGDLTVAGGAVTLGDGGRPVTQAAAGRVQVTSTAGAITGLAGLTLRSDTGGAGGRDLTLQSAAGIALQPGTLLAGGPDRQSALRLGAAPGAAIVLDAVEARTIASPGTATSLAHTGPVTITRAATRDTLAITLTGAGAPALTIGGVEVRGGDLSLDTSGALQTGTIAVPAGAATLAGATVTSGAINARSLGAVARSGAATFTTVDATAGGIAVAAATDLRLARGTATGALSLTSTAGDVTGSAISGGFDPATLTSAGGLVSVRADATDGVRGLIRIASASGAGGVDLAGRTIIAESLASSASAVSASTRRDAAGITNQAMTIGTIEAAGAITLATGNRTVASSAPIALDRATSSGGGIAITTVGGGLAARSGSPRTVLSAPAGAITLDIGGTALLGSASGATTTIAATSLDIETARATGGALALSTRGGPLLLGEAVASGAATIDAAGAITADTVTAASATLTGSAAATLGAIRTLSGDLRATVAGALDAATLDSARGITVDAGSARITSADARGASLALTARTGSLRLDGGRAATDASLTAPALSIGTLDTGGSATLTAAGELTADRLTIGTTLDARADVAAITALTSGGDAQVRGATLVAIGTAATPATLTLAGRGIEVTDAAVGTLDASAGDDGIDLRTAAVTRAAAIRSDAGVTIGTLRAGSAGVTAATTIVADAIVTAGTLNVEAGSDATLTTVETGGDAVLKAGASLAIASVSTPAKLTLQGQGVEVAALDAGVLGAIAGTDGLDLRAGRIVDAADLSSGSDIAIGTLDAGSAVIAASTDLTATRISTRGPLSVSAGADAALDTVESGGVTGLTAGGALTAGAVTTPAALTLAARRIEVTGLDAGSLRATAGADGLDLSRATVGGSATIESDAGAAIGTLDAGSAAITAAAALSADSLAIRNALSLIGERIAVTALTAQSMDANAGAGGFDLQTGSVTGAAQVSSAGTLTFGTLNAGSATLRAATDLTGDRLTTTGAASASAGRDGTLGTVSVGADAALNATRLLSVGSVDTPATLTLSAAGIDTTALEAGTLSVAAGAAGFKLGSAAVARLATIASTGGAEIGTLDAGTIDIRAPGVLAADLLAARAGLGIVAGSAEIATTRVTGGDARITTGDAGLVLGDVVAAEKLDVSTTGVLTAGTLNVGGGMTATAASISLGQANAGAATLTAAAGDLAADDVTTTGGLSASATGDATILRARSGGDAALLAGRTLTLDAFETPARLTLEARRIVTRTLDAGNLTVRAGADGADLRTTAVTGTAGISSGGSLAIGDLTAGAATLAARTTLVAQRITARDRLDVSAASVQSARTSVTAGPASLTANAGDLTLGSAAFASETALTATGALTADLLTVGRTLTARADSLALRTADVGRDATLDGRTATLGAFTSGGNVAIDMRDRLAAETLDVGGRLTVTAESLALNAATVRGGDAVLTAGAAEIAALSTSAASRINTRGVLSAGRIDAGTLIDARGASATIGQATARGGDVSLAATGGDLRLATATASGAVGLTGTAAATVTGAVTAGTSYRIEAASIALGATGASARQAGADVTLLARAGAITAQGSTTVAGARAVSFTANGTGGAITFAPDTAITSSSADVALATTGAAALGTVTASGGAIRLNAADAVLTRAVSAQTVTLTNVASTGVTRLGDVALGNETEFAAPATRFDLSGAETGLIAAPVVTIASGPRDMVIGALALAATTGSTRFAVTANGRIDMLGRFVAAGSPATRTVAIGSEGSAGRTGVIRIAATQADGGRLLVDGAVLELAADRIGAGLDRDFLDAIGYRTNPGLDVDTVTQQYVARPTSTLYTPSALGAAPYTDGVLVRSGVLRLSYGRYALFQNTGRPGEQAGVTIGTLGAAPPSGGTLRLATPNSSNNTFALFGTIDGISSQATALLGPDRLSVDPAVSPVASRINGCIIGSGGGCLNTSIAQPTLNLFDTSRAEIVRTADDLTLPFDPLIGTNNEALYLDTETVAPAADDCEGDKPCPTKP